MSKQNVTLALPARINGEKHLVTGKPISVDEGIAKQLAAAGALVDESVESDSDSNDDAALKKLNKDELLTLAASLNAGATEENTKAQIIELIDKAREQK